MSNQHNRVKKTYTPLPLLCVRTKPAKSYRSSLPIFHKLPVNKSNEHSNNLNNLEKLNEHSNDLSNSEQYSNISNELDQYSSETYQYSSESDKDVDWEINEEEHFLNNVDWENNEVESLHDNINSKNLKDYENYLYDNDNNLMNSDNDNTTEEIEQSTKGYKLFESQSQSFEGFNGEYGPYFLNFTSTMLFLWITEHMISTTAYKELAKILKYPDFSLNMLLQIQHTLSNSVLTKPTYSIMPVDYIESILNNPTIASYLYFGPSIVCDEKCELWHGELW
ncbi:hypothetical protein F8M41_023229 [Gigaspora margarita]|uniref:Uncharacterized protein n=1 Tax=Gigaspora margarita TaxID=4874 RepID=A0A8H4ADS9_GIGMA|nr:hypothetical protein F8M41_023229 [Gigaspora margarita]